MSVSTLEVLGSSCSRTSLPDPSTSACAGVSDESAESPLTGIDCSILNVLLLPDTKTGGNDFRIMGMASL